MLEAALWGFVGAAALLLGAAIALRRKQPISDRAIAFVMAFGAGVLVSAVSLDLTEEALALGGGDATAVGLAAGALVYFAGDHLVPRRPGGDEDDDPEGIVLGALLDGIPESAAIGITLVAGGGVSTSFVAAVFLSNLPESISASTGLREQHRTAWIYRLWLLIAIASAGAAALGYGLLGDASDNALATVSGFAAGAILCMLANTMMPTAFKHGGNKVGLVTVLGFALAALLTTV
jgi:zinc transporter, ZIP family